MLKSGGMVWECEGVRKSHTKRMSLGLHAPNRASLQEGHVCRQGSVGCVWKCQVVRESHTSQVQGRLGSLARREPCYAAASTNKACLVPALTCAPTQSCTRTCRARGCSCH